MKFGKRRRGSKSPPRKLQKQPKAPQEAGHGDISLSNMGSELLRRGVELLRPSRHRSDTVGSSRYRTPTPHPAKDRHRTVGASADEEEEEEYLIPPVPRLSPGSGQNGLPTSQPEDQTPPIPPKSNLRPPPGQINIPQAWDIASSSSSIYSSGRHSFSASPPYHYTLDGSDNASEYQEHPERRLIQVSSQASNLHEPRFVSVEYADRIDLDGATNPVMARGRSQSLNEVRLPRTTVSNLPYAVDTPLSYSESRFQGSAWARHPAERASHHNHTQRPFSPLGSFEEEERGRRRRRSAEVSPLRLPQRNTVRTPARGQACSSDYNTAYHPAGRAQTRSTAMLSPTPIHPASRFLAEHFLVEPAYNQGVETSEAAASDPPPRGRPRGRSVRRIVEELENRRNVPHSSDENDLQ